MLSNDVIRLIVALVHQSREPAYVVKTLERAAKKLFAEGHYELAESVREYAYGVGSQLDNLES